MKIAITADNHLTTVEENPERFHALENIFSQMVAEEIDTIIIAGDLFDASRQNYVEFESLCREPKFKELKKYILPGNHDPAINNQKIVADNVHIINNPELLSMVPDGPDFLFLPYEERKTMGEKIEQFVSKLKPNQWILIGHGDWVGNLREINLYEPGVYMPFTKRDITTYQPEKVFLGHIHKPFSSERIHYPGSPCGLDITETGLRRFLVYDTAAGTVGERTVDTDVIYFNESLIILPAENEQQYILNEINNRINTWEVEGNDTDKIRVRIKVYGYSTDRNALMTSIKRAFKKYTFYEANEPDISDVSISNDPDRNYIAEKVRIRINNLEWAFGIGEPDKDQIILDALHLIYGE